MKANGRQHLDRSMIAAKALELIDHDGLDGLSMRRLGGALGVEGMALYRYYPEKDAILDDVVALVLGDIDYPAPQAGTPFNNKTPGTGEMFLVGGASDAPSDAVSATGPDWQANLRTVARALRERQIDHPNAMPLVATRWVGTPVLGRLFAAAVSDMESAGVDASVAASVVHSVISFVLGHCWVEAGVANGSRNASTEGAATGAMSRAAAPEFERGLDLVLGGARNLMA